MGGFFAAVSKTDCVFDLFFGTDYHSHLGTRRGGMLVYDKDKGFDRAIHNIENAPFLCCDTKKSAHVILLSLVFHSGPQWTRCGGLC